MKRKKGITLLELLAVITIMGILTAIAIPVYHNYLAPVDEATIKTQESEVAKVMNTWVQTYKEVPLKNGDKTLAQIQADCLINYQHPKLGSNVCEINLDPLIKEKKIDFKADGKYFIAYSNKENKYLITRDYPSQYIKALIEQYVETKKGIISNVTYPIKEDNIIDTEKLVDEGLLPEEPEFKFVLLENKEVERIID